MMRIKKVNVSSSRGPGSPLVSNAGGKGRRQASVPHSAICADEAGAFSYRCESPMTFRGNDEPTGHNQAAKQRVTDDKHPLRCVIVENKLKPMLNERALVG